MSLDSETSFTCSENTRGWEASQRGEVGRVKCVHLGVYIKYKHLLFFNMFLLFAEKKGERGRNIRDEREH